MVDLYLHSWPLVSDKCLTVPVSVALSPNEALMCCISSPLLGSHFAIQALPRRVSGDSLAVLTKNLHGDLSRSLVAAIHTRYSPSDVIHTLHAQQDDCKLLHGSRGMLMSFLRHWSRAAIFFTIRGDSLRWHYSPPLWFILHNSYQPP